MGFSTFFLFKNNVKLGDKVGIEKNEKEIRLGDKVGIEKNEKEIRLFNEEERLFNELKKAEFEVFFSVYFKQEEFLNKRKIFINFSDKISKSYKDSFLKLYKPFSGGRGTRLFIFSGIEDILGDSMPPIEREAFYAIRKILLQDNNLITISHGINISYKDNTITLNCTRKNIDLALCDGKEIEYIPYDREVKLDEIVNVVKKYYEILKNRHK